MEGNVGTVTALPAASWGGKAELRTIDDFVPTFVPKNDQETIPQASCLVGFSDTGSHYVVRLLCNMKSTS